MEPKQILSANLLDIIFDNRNKAYGAYDLRVTYPQRIKKSLFFVFIFVLLVFSGLALANSLNLNESSKPKITEVTLTEIEQEPEEPEPLPEPEKPIEQQQVQTQAFTEPRIVPEDEVLEPPPTQEDLADAKIDLVTQEGVVDDGTVSIKEMDQGTGIIETNKNERSDEPFTAVEVDAKYDGNWAKFLLQHLNGNVPADNGAPAGKYQVIIQFVVDLEGKVSDIKPLTSHGYGMEEEAMRVLKKAKNWIPAFQNGNQVKAYRRQPITFEVQGE